MTLLTLFIAAALLTMLAVASYNAWAFPRLRNVPPPADPPSVSVLIPARNEAGVIGATVRRLLDQTLRPREVIVLDDGSDDGTAAAAAAAGDDDCLRVVCGRPLPPGWTGKNWACSQLAALSQGATLVFTDADVIWQPEALAALLGTMTDLDADLLTVWPTQITRSPAERLVVPLMTFSIMAYLPVALVHHTPYPLAAAANGQCLAFRRPAYAAIGGHAAVRSEIIEDVRLAQHVKARGLRLRMADGAGLLLCRMYDGWPAVLYGYAKNILAGHGGSAGLLLLSSLFHLTVFVLPPLWLATSLLSRQHAAAFHWPLLLTSMGIAVRMISAAAARQRLADAFYMPVSVLLMTRIALQALWWQIRYGGPTWKGRVISKKKREQ